jgi:hypothetical protein
LLFYLLLQPIGNNPTFFNCAAQITTRDIAEAAIGGAFFYVVGFTSGA